MSLKPLIELLEFVVLLSGAKVAFLLFEIFVLEYLEIITELISSIVIVVSRV